MKRTTRRDFIKLGASTAAIVAAGAPLMFPSRSAAAAENAASAKSLPKFAKVGMLIDTSGAGKAWQGGIQLFNQLNQGKMEVAYDTTDFSSLLQKESLLFFGPVSTTYFPSTANGRRHCRNSCCRSMTLLPKTAWT
jgi:hypothetical protein